MSTPTVVILAAGANSRFFPFNARTHKTALPLQGSSLILRTLQNLADYGFRDVVIVVSPKDANGQGMSAQVAERQLDLDVQFVAMEEPTGMGDALLLTKEYLKETFAVVHPTCFNAGETLRAMLEMNRPDGVILAQETDTPWEYGILDIDQDRVVNIVEKPEKGGEPSNIKAYEIWLLTNKYLSVLEETPHDHYSFEHALAEYFKDHNVGYYMHTSFKLSLKYPWHIFDYQKHFFDSMSSFRHESASVAQTAVIDDSAGPVVIEEGAKIHDFAKITGPAYIGKDVLIGEYSFIRHSSIEKESTIGANTEVVRSIIMENVSVHFGYIADSIIGTDAKIGAGLIVANKRHDRQEIQMMVKDEKVATGRSSLGVLIGDGAKIGINVSTMPGVAIGANATIWPSLTLFSHVQHDQVLTSV